MPLTSIQCWHVHCEECWLRTLVRWHETVWAAVSGTVQMFTFVIAPAWGRQGTARSQEFTAQVNYVVCTLILGLPNSPLHAFGACAPPPFPPQVGPGLLTFIGETPGQKDAGSG